MLENFWVRWWCEDEGRTDTAEIPEDDPDLRIGKFVYALRAPMCGDHHEIWARQLDPQPWDDWDDSDWEREEAEWEESRRVGLGSELVGEFNADV